ncbi:MAG: hypothetical protein HQ483_16840 [Rhodospirillales bacterium]|nr:hypothetical protein [Rhodospirillales bacterium]
MTGELGLKHMRFDLAKIVMVVVVGLVVSACGVKSSPQAPDDATYPRQYPTPLPPLVVKPQKAGPAEQTAPVVSDPNSFWQYPNTPPGQ